MKQKIVYECDCGKIFTTEVECMHCEASHYPISIKEYYKWHYLKKWLDILERDGLDGYAIRCAMHDLMVFESEHHLPSSITKE